MSSVRMCDDCHEIFSENDENWATGQISVQRRRDSGARYTEQMQQDRCGPCVTGTAKAAPAAVAVTAGDQAAAAEREDDHVMLRELQRQVDELNRGGQAVTTPERMLWLRSNWNSAPSSTYLTTGSSTIR
jgi:hypothetical protein